MTAGNEGIDAHLQAGHDWLLSFADVDDIESRIQAERDQIAETHMGSGTGVYGPASEDLVAAYLLLARASFSAPTPAPS